MLTVLLCLDFGDRDALAGRTRLSTFNKGYDKKAIIYAHIMIYYKTNINHIIMLNSKLIQHMHIFGD